MQYIPFLISGLVPVALSKSLFEATSNTRIDGNDIAAIFGPVLTPEAHIFLPSDGDYDDNVMARWSTFNDPSYVATVKPATETDVQAIVSTAASHNITFFRNWWRTRRKVELWQCAKCHKYRIEPA